MEDKIKNIEETMKENLKDLPKEVSEEA